VRNGDVLEEMFERASPAQSPEPHPGAFETLSRGESRRYGAYRVVDVQDHGRAFVAAEGALERAGHERPARASEAHRATATVPAEARSPFASSRVGAQLQRDRPKRELARRT
jgi:hypothetical protein